MNKLSPSWTSFHNEPALTIFLSECWNQPSDEKKKHHQLVWTWLFEDLEQFALWKCHALAVPTQRSMEPMPTHLTPSLSHPLLVSMVYTIFVWKVPDWRTYVDGAVRQTSRIWLARIYINLQSCGYRLSRSLINSSLPANPPAAPSLLSLAIIWCILSLSLSLSHTHTHLRMRCMCNLSVCVCFAELRQVAIQHGKNHANRWRPLRWGYHSFFIKWISIWYRSLIYDHPTYTHTYIYIYILVTAVHVRHQQRAAV
jgi:hypothetical protein